MDSGNGTQLPPTILSHDKRKAAESRLPTPKRQRTFNGSSSGGGSSSAGGGSAGSQGSQASLYDDSDDFPTQLDIDMFEERPHVEGEEGCHWERPQVPPFSCKTDDLVFQQLEADYTVGDVLPGMPGASVGPVPIVRLFGVTEEGNSVLCLVHGFAPYFYVPAPPNVDAAYLNNFAFALNRCMKDKVTNQGRAEQYVLDVRVVKKQSIMGYSESDLVPFLEITVALPKHVATCRGLFEETGIPLGNGQVFRAQTYETNLAYALRFMIDRGIMGASWLRLPAGRYRLVSDRVPKKPPLSTCQIEVDVSFEEAVSLGSSGEWSKIAPFRILSFDIECAGRKGVFPDPEQDSVIQIANVITCQGDRKPIIKNVFSLRTCSAIVGAHVLNFADERDLLLKWADFVLEADPDMIIGYNINNFDLPFLMKRAKKLKAEKFSMLGRIRGYAARLKEGTFSSKAYGKHDTVELLADGRIFFDVLQIVQREHKLRSYTLNSVSAHFLSEQKEEVHHSIITDLFNGSADDRRRLAVYCLKDALLPQRLVDKLMINVNSVEMARVTGVPLSYLVTRGQQIKVVSQLYRKARERNLVIPVYKIEGGAGEDVGFEGATVIEPERGYYDTPVATLDFASLYPSIMMAHNLCYCTLLRRDQAARMNPADYLETPSKDLFVSANVRKGLLPQILEDLLSARAKAKADLKKETDPQKRAVLDGRQLALKISANSVYGFTGATIGKLPCLEISQSVTAFGRQMIEKTKQVVEERYNIAAGFAHDSRVIYGDTDSVMVRFGVSTVEEAMALGREAAAFVSKSFVKPISLEFEKVYFPFLLINKKRYAGLYWTRAETWDKIDTKGIETVRRDNCLLVRNLITDCLQKILIDRDLPGAIQHVKSTITDLLQNRLDLSLLVISKALSKEGSEYAAKQAHVELAERMRKRDAGSAPNIGDRVPYVIIKAFKGAKAFEKSEDPLWVLEHNIPLDYQYYLENQLKKPLLRIFDAIIPNPLSLLVGEHTRTISVPTPTTGGIVGFAVKRRSCLGCKMPLSSTDHTVCNNCRSREADIYQQRLETVNQLEKQHARVWTQCQNCQGSLHQTVLCSSRDCPIFYMRKKVQKDLKDAATIVESFQW